MRPTPPPPIDEFAELKSLLFAAEQADLDGLRRRLEGSSVAIEDVSRVLPYALSVEAHRERGVSASLAPALADGLARAARQDPRALAEALGPALLPALAAAGRHSLGRAARRADEGLHAALTLRPLRWRVEAWRRGKAYADIARTRTTRFAIQEAHLLDALGENVLLATSIRRGVAGKPKRRADVIAAASRRAFHPSGETHDGLRAASVRTDGAVLVLVWRGTAPIDLVKRAADLLTSIEAAHAEAFGATGDPNRFAPLLPLLDVSLAWRDAPARRRPYYVLGTVAAAVLVAAGALAWPARSEPAATPAPVVASARIPATVSPAPVAVETPRAPIMVPRYRNPLRRQPVIGSRRGISWEEMLERHASEPMLALDGRTPVASADASRSWGAALADLRPRPLRVEPAKAPPSVTPAVPPPPKAPPRLDSSPSLMLTVAPTLSLERTPLPSPPPALPLPRDPLREAIRVLEAPDTVRLRFEDGVLAARGQADRAWIEQARETYVRVEGVRKVDLRHVMDLDRKRLDRARVRLGSTHVLFGRGTATPALGQRRTMDRIEADIRAIEEAASILGLEATVEIVSRALGRSRGPNGSADAALGYERAQVVHEHLRRRGIENVRIPPAPTHREQAPIPSPQGPQAWVSFRVRLSQ